MGIIEDIKDRLRDRAGHIECDKALAKLTAENQRLRAALTEIAGWKRFLSLLTIADAREAIELAEKALEDKP